MTTTMTIGDFSRATHLSAKALRLYHRLGLLEPASVDPFTGYRSYGVDQVPDAHLIKHFRSLEMPLDVIGQVLQSAPSARADLIAEHLRRMEDRLAETRDAVAALRGLLAAERVAATVERRTIGATPALVVRGDIALAELGPWFTAAQEELARAVERPEVVPVGPLGGLWSSELMLDEQGRVTLFRPVGADTRAPADGRVTYEVLPPVVLAVATHRGAEATIGQTYADLGQHVARHETSVEGPVRETYLAGTPGVEGVTEIGWPVR